MCSNEVRDHGVDIKWKNWVRYEGHTDAEVAQLVREFGTDLQKTHGNRITRGLVCDAFQVYMEKGVLASLVWGYPKGKFPGGRSFDGILSEARQIGITLSKLRKEALKPASEICDEFAGYTRLGPSTFTKMLYFAGIKAVEGQCLIYDQMVMRTISQSNDPEWAALRETLGPCLRETGRFRQYSPALQIQTYGAFLSAVHQQVNPARSADSIELALFNAAPRGRKNSYQQA